jgi:hypothetical protein
MITSAWSPLDADIKDFVDEFDRRSAGSGTETTALFASNFLALEPARAVALTPAILAAALPARRGMFDAAGVGDIRRADARQLRLDDQHIIVSVDWTAERAGRNPLRLESTFLVRREPDGPRIVVYLNHHDIAAMLSAGSI